MAVRQRPPVAWTPEAIEELTRFQNRMVKAEFNAALELVSQNPRIGRVVSTLHGQEIRRVVLRRSELLLYYFLQAGMPWMVSVWPSHAGTRPLER